MEEKRFETWCTGGVGHEAWLLESEFKESEDLNWVCKECKKFFPNRRTFESAEVGERPWGKYFVLDEHTGYKVKRIEVLPGKRLSLQSHSQRAEVWTAVAGTGKFLVGDSLINALPGQMVYVGLDQKHRMINDGDEMMVVIEVQLGSALSEDDITRYEDDFGRHEKS